VVVSFGVLIRVVPPLSSSWFLCGFVGEVKYVVLAGYIFPHADILYRMMLIKRTVQRTSLERAAKSLMHSLLSA
jgi:hypothetical protein